MTHSRQQLVALTAEELILSKNLEQLRQIIQPYQTTQKHPIYMYYMPLQDWKNPPDLPSGVSHAAGRVEILTVPNISYWTYKHA